MKVIYEVWSDDEGFNDCTWQWSQVDKKTFLTYNKESRRTLAIAETEADERELEAIYGD